jgi:hypothetical protein
MVLRSNLSRHAPRQIQCWRHLPHGARLRVRELGVHKCSPVWQHNSLRQLLRSCSSHQDTLTVEETLQTRSLMGFRKKLHVQILAPHRALHTWATGWAIPSSPKDVIPFIYCKTAVVDGYFPVNSFSCSHPLQRMCFEVSLDSHRQWVHLTQTSNKHFKAWKQTKFTEHQVGVTHST